MARIFINYRREDADDWAHTVAARLIAALGREAVFIDVDADLPPGLDYRREIEAAVAACDIMISVIGRDWRRALADRKAAHEGGARLDLVRVEIAKALERDIPVIPLLVDRTEMPAAPELPGDIADLAYRESRGLRVVSQDDDLKRLVDGVSLLLDRLGAVVEAPHSQSARERSVGAIFRDALRDGGEGPEMVVIPAGRFLMGSPKDEPQRETWKEGVESPQHEVTIANPFAIGRFAVTRGDFAAFVSATGHDMSGGIYWHDGKGWKKDSARSWGDPGFAQDDRHPVVGVSCKDAESYCAWLSEQAGEAYQLPSEAEWEYACRAGSTTPFWWGAAITPEQANYNGNYAYAGGGAKGAYRKRTEPVDAFEPNPWGLCQVHGNVLEWCADAWNENYAGAPSDGSAWRPGDTSSAVLRGGSWGRLPENLRSADRGWSSRAARSSGIGFRVSRTLGE